MAIKFMNHGPALIGALLIAVVSLGCAVDTEQRPTSTPQPTITLAAIATATTERAPDEPPRTVDGPETSATPKPTTAPPETEKPTATVERLPTTPTTRTTDPPALTLEATHTPASSQPNTETRMAMASVMERLPEQDRECITEEQWMADDWDAALIYSGEAEDLIECLSDEGEFQIYLMQAEAEGTELTTEQHQCIWEGTSALIKAAEREEEQQTMGNAAELGDAFSRILEGAIFGVIATAVYCAGPEALADTSDSGIDPEEAAVLICHVEQAGGPGPFAENLFEKGLEETLAETEPACGSLGPQP